MQMIEIKVTLLRSNPQLIRELLVPYTYTWEMLHRALLIVIGRSGEYTYDFESCPSKSRLDECIHEGNIIIYRLKQNNSGFTWTFRLQTGAVRETDKDQENAVPCVLRCRGANLPERCSDIMDFNRVQLEWLEPGYYYSFRKKELKEQDYRFSVEAANRELKRSFGAREEEIGTKAGAGENSGTGWDIRLNESCCLPLDQILKKINTTELRAIAARAGIECSRAAKRENIIRKILSDCEEGDYIKRCFMEMTMTEFQTFRSITGSDKIEKTLEEQRRYKTLLAYGLIIFSPSDKRLICSRELVRGYSRLAESSFRDEYENYQKAARVIRAGCALYGVLSQAQMERLFAQCCPGEIRQEDMELYCSQFEKYGSGTRYQRIKKELFFCTADVRRGDAEEMKNYFAKIPAYLPRKNELEEIERDGLIFCGTDRERFEEYLKKYIGVPEEQVPHYHREVYRGLHIGMDEEQIAEWLLSALGKRVTVSQKKSVADMLVSMGHKVRRIVYQGYTEDEIRRIRRR